MRDWRAIAAAQKIELSDTAVARLEGLEKTLLGLRGLVDWQEEPSTVFPGEPFALPEPRTQGEEA
jgi:hypothetical protein